MLTELASRHRLSRVGRVLLTALPLASTALLVAASPSAASPTFRIVSTTSFTDSRGNVVVVGEIQNNGDRTADFVRADVTFTDGSDRVLGTTTTYTRPDYVGPTELASFRTFGTTPAGTTSYTVSISGDQASRRPSRLDAEVTNRFTDSVGYEHFAGTLTNRNSYDSRFSEADFTFYNGAGEAVDSDFTFANGNDAAVPSGQKVAFELVRSPQQPEFARFAVVGDGNPPSGYQDPNPEGATSPGSTPPKTTTSPPSTQAFQPATVKADSTSVRRTGEIGVTTRNLLAGRVVKVFEERTINGRFVSTNKGQATVNSFGTTRFSFRPTAVAGPARIVVVGADRQGKPVRSSFTVTVR